MVERRRTAPQAWKPGQSGNPAGKPPGCRNKATQMVMALMEGGAEEVTRTVIDAAKAGDLTAARLVIERLAPPLRERPLSLPLPDTGTVAGVSAAQQAILQAVGEGEILPGEGTALAGIVGTRRKTLGQVDTQTRPTAPGGGTLTFRAESLCRLHLTRARAKKTPPTRNPAPTPSKKPRVVRGKAVSWMMKNNVGGCAVRGPKTADAAAISNRQ